MVHNFVIFRLHRYRKVYKWSDDQLGQMRDEVVALKLDKSLDDIADGCREDGCLNIFQLWEKVGSIMKAGKACYSTIKCLALLLLVTPHSNAQSERIFSMVNKNLRADRSCLDKDTTLNSIMIIKTRGLTLDFAPSDALLKSARQATRLMLSDK